MPVSLYFDHNFSGPIIEILRRREVATITAWEDRASETDDPVLLDRATTLGCVLATGDEDLLSEAARRQRAGIAFAGVIYCHQREQHAIGARADVLELLAKASEPDDLANRVQYLPL